MVHMLVTLTAREQQLRVAEQSVRRSEQHFRSLIENVTDVVVQLDAQGLAKYISPSLTPAPGLRRRGVARPARWPR